MVRLGLAKNNYEILQKVIAEERFFGYSRSCVDTFLVVKEAMKKQ